MLTSFFGLTHNIIRKKSNNLACAALQFFLCLFCACFALLKKFFQTEIQPKKVLRLNYFCKKRQNFFFFLRPPSGVTNIDTSPMAPLFENFSLDALNSEQKPSVKKRLTGRSTGGDFEI